MPGGFQVIGVHDSKASWDAFVAGHFIPLMQQGIPGGFAAAPTALEFEATHVFP